MPIVVPLVSGGGVVAPSGTTYSLPGSSVSGDGEYEFGGVVFNRGGIMVLGVDGLFGLPDSKAVDYEQMNDDGGVLGNELLGMRTILMDLAVEANTEALIQPIMEQLRYIMQPQAIETALTFQRAGLGKRLVMCKPRRMGGFATDYIMASGLAKGSLMFVASDPRILDYLESVATITIAASGTSNSGTITQTGTFSKGAWPILEIDGPSTNPRISNQQAGGRSIKLDIVVNAGQTLVIDVKRRSATVAGVDQSATIRSDNQWWRLAPGPNIVQYSRSNSPSTASPMRVRWRNTWI